MPKTRMTLKGLFENEWVKSLSVCYESVDGQAPDHAHEFCR